jgi:hypothetical protein
MMAQRQKIVVIDDLHNDVKQIKSSFSNSEDKRADLHRQIAAHAE